MPSLEDAGNGLEKISTAASVRENFSVYVGLYPGCSLQSCIRTPATLPWLWCKRIRLLFLASLLIVYEGTKPELKPDRIVVRGVFHCNSSVKIQLLIKKKLDFFFLGLMPSIDHNCAEHPSAILWHCAFIQCTSSRSLKVFCVSVCERSVFSVRQGGKRWGLLQAPWLHPAEPAGDPRLVTKQGNFCQSELCILVCLGFVCASKFFMDMMFFGICVVQLQGLGSGVCTSRLYRAPTRLCPLSFRCRASPQTDRYNAGVTAFLFLSVFANRF